MENALDSLDALLRQPGIWRAGERDAASAGAHVATGFAHLDDALPGGGLPLGALTEILHARQGIGELRLLMPALARLSHRGKWIAMVAPPHIPYAPALANHGVDLSRILLIHPRARHDALWAVEQALRNGTCGAVLAWPKRIDERSLRRLQIAAAEGGSLGAVFRHGNDTGGSPSALRLRLSPAETGLQVDIVKCRGGRPQRVILDMLPDLPTPAATAPPAVTRPLPTQTPPPPREPAVAGRRNRGRRRRAAQMDLPLPQRTPASRSEPAGTESQR